MVNGLHEETFSHSDFVAVSILLNLLLESKRDNANSTRRSANLRVSSAKWPSLSIIEIFMDRSFSKICRTPISLWARPCYLGRTARSRADESSVQIRVARRSAVNGFV